MLSSKRKLAKILTGAILAFGMLGGVTGWATAYYVNDATGNDGNDGLSPATAKKTIQQAVNTAGLVFGVSDTIEVAEGTYTLASEISIDGTRNITTIKSAAGAASTIVNGDGVTGCFNINNASVVVDGFTITNGCDTDWRGSGVCIRESGGTVRNCIISGNIFNRSAEGGGGVALTAGVVENCVITGNTVENSTSHGGGVYIWGGTVRNCTISGNSSAGSGGGVYLYGGTISNCTISGNWGDQQWGSAVFNNSGTIRNCLIMGNYTTIGLGANQCGCVVQNDATMENCTLVGNYGPTYTPMNAGDTHRVYTIYNSGTMRNCIVVNNSPGFGNSGTRCTYSCTTPLVSGMGNIMQDPQFVDSGSGSGTGFVAGDYRLMAYSPCINAGTNVAWMTSATDRAGNARIINTIVDMGAYEYTDTSATRIAAPASVTATDGTYGDKVRVTWSSVAGATGYAVYRGDANSNVDFSAFVTVAASPYNDTNALPGTNYYYWVAASDANGRSLLSGPDRGYASLYGVNFDNAQVVYLDGNKHLQKIDTKGVISTVFTGTNPAIEQIVFNQQGDLFLAFPQGWPQGGIVLNDGYTNIVAKATPASNTLVGIDHEIMQLSWWSQIASPNIQVDAAGNAYYFAVREQTQTGNKIALRKYINGSTNLVDLIPGDNIQIYGWYVRPDGTVLMAGRTDSTASDWFRKLSPQGNLSHIINPPVTPSFILAFPDDMIYAGVQSWTYNGADYWWPGVYRLPPDLSNPQFSFPYIGDSNQWDSASNQRIFAPEYDINAVMAGHGSTWSSGFGQCKGAAIRQYATTTENGAPSRVFVTAGNWSGSKTLVQYYPIVQIIELQGIETVTLIEALGDKLVIAGSQGSNEKLILYDPANGAEMDLLEENIEIYHLQTMYTGHIWFDGLKFTGNKYIAGQFTMEIVYGANGKQVGFRAPKAPKSAYREVTLADKPNAFVGVLASSANEVVIPDTAPDAPTGLKASGGTYSDKVQLTWQSATGATSYEVWRNTSDNSGSAAKLGDAATAGYDDTTTEAGNIYYYWGKAVNAIGSSDFSASAQGWSSSVSRNLAADFDGDGKADPATVDESGNWYVWFSASGYAMGGPYPLMSGLSGSPAAGDFDGDGKADPAMMDGSGNWYVWFSSAGYAQGGPYMLGVVGGTPLAGDFDGDRKADPAIVNGSGDWFICLSSIGYSGVAVTFSVAGGAPLAGDFDGDRLADPAMVAAGNWYVWFSGLIYAQGGPYAMSVTGGSPVTGDLDGDRKSDPAMVASGNWYVWFSASGYAQGGPYPLGAP